VVAHGSCHCGRNVAFRRRNDALIETMADPAPFGPGVTRSPRSVFTQLEFDVTPRQQRVQVSQQFFALFVSAAGLGPWWG
jgi:hypothetical protein